MGNGSPSDPPIAQTVPTNQTTPTAAAAPIAGACVEQYDLDALANRDFAFDGTLTSVNGDQVTFMVNQVSCVGGLTLSEGERYLVAGSGPFVWACGFTQAYGPTVAADWASVFAE